MQDAGIQQQGPDSVALLFATEADVRNGTVWEQWLQGAPPKSYTIYVHAQHPGRVTTPLFKDSLVNEHAFVAAVPLGAEPAAGGTGVDMHGASTSKSSAPMEHNRGDGQPGDAGAQKPMDSIMALLKEALKEPSNKWFMVLDDACLPMVAFDTFFEHMALHPTKSIFDVHPEKVQSDMLGILQFVTGVPALVRDAIKNNDLVAHSPIGTMLVRRDAEMLANAPSAVLHDWERALSSGPLQDALFSPHGAQYFGHCIQQEPTAQQLTLSPEDTSDLIDDFFRVGGVPAQPGADQPARASKPQSIVAVPAEREHSQGKTSVPSAASTQAPQSLRRSLCLSVDELFLFALLRHLRRLKHGEPQAHKKVVRVHHVFCGCVCIGVYVRVCLKVEPRAALPRADLHICGHTAAHILPPQHKLVYSRCCLIMGNCECSLSRPLRPATYASLPKDFISGCIDRESMFGRNFDTLFGVKLQDLEVRRMLDMWLYVHMDRERAAMHDLTRRARRCVREFLHGDALWWCTACLARCSGPPTRNRKKRHRSRKKSRLGGCPVVCRRCFWPPRTPPPPCIPGCTSIRTGRGVPLRRVWGILRRWEQGRGVQVTGRCQGRARLSCRGMTSVNWYLSTCR
jgi:hypothetical protein